MFKFLRFFSRSKRNRYSQLLDIIKEIRPKNIMEIGTYSGSTALKMIQESQKYNSDILYAGFDLFEDMTPELFSRDPSARPPAPREKKVMKKLSVTGAKIFLYRGQSSQLMPTANLPPMDLIFIDGSHKLADIENDWENSKRFMHPKTVVVFDDYWEGGWNGDYAFGCNRLIENLKGYKTEILPIKKFVPKEWGILSIQLVKVTKI